MDKAELEALKAAHPIPGVLRALGVEAQGGRFRCPRPENHAHGDRTPSVSVRADRGTFRCWVCPDVRGDVIDLVRLVRGCSFREALDFLRGAPGGSPGGPAGGGFGGARAAGGPAGATASGTSFPTRQTDLFPAPTAAAPAVAPLRPVPPAPVPEPIDEELRKRVLKALLDTCPPVAGPVARYLQKRRIFKRTWETQQLRMVDDYGGISDRLAAAFGTATLERAGFFNAAGHLRFYRHRLLFPYFNRSGEPVYMQARAIEPDAKPKELSLPGPIPLPYNCPLLDGEPGHVFLCEGVIDTLTLLEQGFPALGVPGAANFKPAWAALFSGKTVHVAFDPDAPGNAGAARAMDILTAAGIEARRLSPPEGMDLNDWFRKG